ncbi:MAG TPA: AAA family ATPase [Steroidobacteraceae bacterium]|nr:AAA family ATPase [Steroidobacteraceae bacterium]
MTDSIDIGKLLRASAFPHPTDAIRCRETHVSWVILTGSFAYKIKKSVRLEFLDMTRLATRHALCNEELRLNRRLAPELYVDVVPITQDAQGLYVGGRGTVVEYAVKMRQFDASQELPALLERGDVTTGEIAALGVDLAEFHRRAPPADGRAARAGAGPTQADAGLARAAATPPPYPDFDYRRELRQSVLGTLATLVAHYRPREGFEELSHLIDWTHDALHDLARDFAARLERGFVRECHGDLHARNIVRWEGRLTPFDCLEFDPRLRWIDVMNDVAFLYMDLMAHRRKDLAYQFLSSYLEVMGDYSGVRLLPFYAAYRALVRAMVDALSAEQRPTDRESLDERLEGRIHTATDLTRPARPTLNIMHGASGSGKSWVSERLVPLLGAIRIRSDLERKRESTSAGDGSDASSRYTRKRRERTYRYLRECARAPLAVGVSVIVDATFLDFRDRQAFREVAAAVGADFRIISCNADEALMTRRIRDRAGHDPSEADITVLAAQLREMQPLRAEEEGDVVRLETGAPDIEERIRKAICPSC